MTLELQNVKMILEALVDKGALKPEQQQEVLTGIENGSIKGFAGEAVVKNGWVPQEVLTATLQEQAARKAQAAVKDIGTVATSGKQETPATLKVNLGNNGINPAPAQPTLTDAASAAANIAQNIVLLANAEPKIAPDLVNAVKSASALTMTLSGISNQPVALPVLQQWEREAEEGLLKATAHFQTSDVLRETVLHPENRQQVPSVELVKQFLGERNKELNAGLAQLSTWQNRAGEGPSRGGPALN